MTRFKKTATAAGLVAFGLAATNAQADPLTQLHFSQNAGFLDPVVEFNTGALAEVGFSNATDQTIAGDGNPVTPLDTFLKYAWRGSDLQVESFIEIESFTDASAPDVDQSLASAPLKFMGPLSDGNVDTTGGEWNEGDWWVIDTLTQTNNELFTIDGGPVNPLWILDALANLRIFSDAARTDQLFIDKDSGTRISFNETQNTATAAGCPAPNPNGTLCDDIFTILAAELDPVSFNYLGYKYTLDFALLPGVSTDGTNPILLFDDLGDPIVDGDGNQLAETSIVIPDGNGINVYTPEILPGTSSIHVLMNWSAAKIEVPEPGILGLFGVGMLGLGMSARRRRK